MSANAKDAAKTAKRGLKKDDIPASKRPKKTEDLETALPKRSLRSGTKDNAPELVSLEIKPKSKAAVTAAKPKAAATAPSKEKKDVGDSKKGKSKADAKISSDKTETNDVPEEEPEVEVANGDEKSNGDVPSKATKKGKGRTATKTAALPNKAEKNGVPEEKTSEDEKTNGEAKVNGDVAAKGKKAAATTKGTKGRAAKVVMEHWKAVEIRDYVSKFLAFPFELNPTKPRRQSFEIRVIDISGNEHLIWSGVKKGPPRALKFPTPELILEELSAFK